MPKSKIQDLIDDPFTHLRNKEKAEEKLLEDIREKFQEFREL